MRHGVESQGLLEQLSIELQELAGVGRASIRDDKDDIQILRMLVELRDEALLRDVHREGAELNTKVPLVIWRPTSLSNASLLATITRLIPAAAICRANSAPIPVEAPVTSAHGPNCCLSSNAFMVPPLLST